MSFYIGLGWFIFWIGLIVAIILFANTKKIYPVFYLASISLYIFTVGFLIDVFELQELGILSVLLFSAVLFMLLGYYLSKVIDLKSH